MHLLATSTATKKRAFDHFKEWVTAIYQRAADIGAPINDDMRAMFDKMLGKEMPVEYFDPLLKNKDVQNELRRQAKNAGWEEVGGKVIMDENHVVIGAFPTCVEMNQKQESLMDIFISIVIGVPVVLFIFGGSYWFVGALFSLVDTLTEPSAPTAAELREQRKIDRLLQQADKQLTRSKKWLENSSLK